MRDNSYLVDIGSKSAKDGFKTEQYVIDEFNGWKDSTLGQEWLKKMSYDLSDVEYVHAEKITGSYKADVQVAVRVSVKLKHLEDIQNLQVKLVSNPRGFNQIDKRKIQKYKELWDIPDDVVRLLQHFTGEVQPHRSDTRDKRRMFIDEFSDQEQKLLVGFITKNKTLIVSDILKGRGKFAAEWMLVILKDGIDSKSILWALEPMNLVLNFFGNGPVTVTGRGSVNIGKITMQRKGGDNGRETASMLQFKINPALLVSQSFN